MMKTLKRLFLALTVVCGLVIPAAAQSDGSPESAETPVMASVAERFSGTVSKAATPDTAAGVPDFQRHVVPLLGKLGCNGRACHGSFQGRGDFRLSLFGYDFDADHNELHGRLDPLTPGESLILQKPLMQIPHEGGRRLTEGSWEHRLLLAWIQHEAPARSDKPATLTKMLVTPSEIQFASEGQQQALSAVAVWSDGTREDVTALCRFQTNDEDIAEVTQDGLVTSGASGDTHVVVFYDSAVIPVPVLRPVSDRTGEKYPETPAPTEVDQLVQQKLKKLGIVQSDVCSDEQFLRRASLDVTGTLPTPAEVTAFLADTAPDKRARKVDELLERPGYVAWWTTRLCDFTGNSDDQLNNVTPVRAQASRQWYDWIFKRVQDNMPYDDLVEGIVMAVSRNPGESYEEYCENLSQINRGESGASFADRTWMPHYWSRQNFQTSEDRVIGFAYTFLGTRIQCAQCHKHPFDRWTQEDFQKFEGFFKGTQGRVAAPHAGIREDYNRMVSELPGTDGLKGNQLLNQFAKLLRDGRTVPFGEVYAVPPARSGGGQGDKNRNRNRNRPSVPSSARVLGGEQFDLTGVDDIRRPLMDWLRSPDNPLFARAFVNRVWAGYFHRGIVHPSDDLNLANPPSNAALLDYLADGFVQHDFDMKWVHRTILNSRTYQLSWVPNETNRLDERNFSRAVPRRVPAEVMYDMLAQAVGSTQLNASLVTDLDNRAVSISGSGTRNRNRSPADYALTVFGRSTRESNCDCDRSEEPSLLQTIFVRNDGQLLEMMSSKDSWLAEIAARYELPFEVAQSDQGRRGRDQQENQVRRRLQERMASLRKQLSKAEQSRKQQLVERLKEQIAKVKQQLDGQKGESAGDTDTGNPSVPAPPQPGVVLPPQGWDSAQLVEEAWLRTLSRRPTDEEKATAERYMEESTSPMEGLKSVLWALLNTKEFIVNH